MVQRAELAFALGSPARVMSRTHQGDEAMDEAPNLKSELVSVGFKKEKKKTLTKEI